MRRTLAVAAIMLSLTGGVAAQETTHVVTLAREEMVSVQLDSAHPSAVVISERGAAAAMSAFAQQAARDFSPGGVYQDDTGESAISLTGPSKGLDPLPTNALRLTFAQVPREEQTVLTIENGYAQAVFYRAVMHIGDDAQITDVCLVKPNSRSFEHWPHLIDSIDLFEFELQDWREGDPLPCR